MCLTFGKQQLWFQHFPPNFNSQVLNTSRQDAKHRLCHYMCVAMPGRSWSWCRVHRKLWWQQVPGLTHICNGPGEICDIAGTCSNYGWFQNSWLHVQAMVGVYSNTLKHVVNVFVYAKQVCVQPEPTELQKQEVIHVAIQYPKSRVVWNRGWSWGWVGVGAEAEAWAGAWAGAGSVLELGPGWVDFCFDARAEQSPEPCAAVWILPSSPVATTAWVETHMYLARRDL